MGLLWFGKKEPKHKPPDSGAQGNHRWGNAHDIARIGGLEEVGREKKFHRKFKPAKKAEVA